ncbi:DUF2130 domain-containing protein [Candidatus Peregrinibacteria bacterium CG10_big_fil_rev_8_21_14_0_10_36_19]|nr:MAG: DUF2130 domain-containing protein [Candidatus Peregrinibacteria bacterium CG10_big_fil_rev_8_21_14_0_10_36_19]
MTDQTITCPKCATSITLNDALTEKIQNQLKSEMEKEISEREKLISEKEKNLDAQVAKKLESEKLKMWEVAQKKAEEKLDIELKDLKKTNEEKNAQLEKMREEQLELRKEKREIEEEKKNMKLEIERKLDEERKRISEEAKKDASEEMRLKMAEKDKQMEQLRRSLEDAKRKSEQGSMQIQGDVQEDDLKIMLQNAFPMDTISDVPTGVKGADLVQTVNSSFGQKAGVILWESKNTKAWSADWIKKLKDDQAIAKADVCLLVSQTLPDDVKDFKFEGGVWICSYQSALSLVTVLRLHITQISQVKQSLVGKDEKMELLYNYLSGSEFKNRIENIVSAFTSMQIDLDTERRSMERIWKKRSKEIERVVMSTSGMYGDLQGIVGASLPTIKSLELPGADYDEVEEY